MEREQAQAIMLPLTVVSRVDIGRLLRELEAIDDFLVQAAIRTPGTPVTMPRTTKQLETLAVQNGLNLLQTADRKKAVAWLTTTKDRAPSLHMSFTTEPSTNFIDKLLGWIRTNLGSNILLEIGLQPTIAAGCVIRTPNHYFDLSLRRDLAKKTDLLLQQIQQSHIEPAPTVPQMPTATPAATTGTPITVTQTAPQPAVQAATPVIQAPAVAPPAAPTPTVEVKL